MKVIAISIMFGVLALQAGQFVTYEEFGAKGDGKTDDFPAIVQAHNYANEHQLPIRANDGKTYLLGANERPAVIKTDTDWGKAHFIVNDAEITEKRTRDIFAVKPTRASTVKKLNRELKSGSTALGFAPGFTALVKIENRRVKHFIRKGLNQNSGSNQQEIFLVDQDGKIHPDTPVLWDYPANCQLRLFPIEEKPLVIRGGIFETRANAVPNNYPYFKRGIEISRAQTTLSGLKHVISGEGEQGAPYAAFVSVSQTAYVTIDNCELSGHKFYYAIGRAGKPVQRGTYDLGARHACFVTFQNCRQIDDIQDRTKWGIFGSNFCRRLTLENCVLSRFDAHQGVADAVLRNCQFGRQSINAIGFGTLLVENCRVKARQFINLRNDYGCFWRGKFIIRNSVLEAGNGVLIHAENPGDHDFGYPCMMPEEITVENFRFENGKSKVPAAVFAGRISKPGAKYPYQLPKKCTLKNVTAANRRKIVIPKEVFKECKVSKK